MDPSELTKLIHSKYELAAREKYFNRFKSIKPDSKVALIRFDKDQHLIKYLLPDTSTIIDLMMCVRKNKVISSQAGLFCLIEDRDYRSFMVVGHVTIGEIYEKYKRDDGLLYINICKENTFG